MYLTSRETPFSHKALVEFGAKAPYAPSVTVYPILTERT